MPTSLNEEIIAFNYCIFDSCNSLVRKHQNYLLGGKVPNHVTGNKVDQTPKNKDFEADRIFGQPDGINNCQVNYDENNTETDYIMGYTQDTRDKNRVNRDAEVDAARAKEAAESASSYRFKESNKAKNGFMVKLGS